MFTLKDGYEFGQLLRREREYVRAELTEKVLAYNIAQILRVRARKQLDNHWPHRAKSANWKLQE